MSCDFCNLVISEVFSLVTVPRTHADLESHRGTMFGESTSSLVVKRANEQFTKTRLESFADFTNELRISRVTGWKK